MDNVKEFLELVDIQLTNIGQNLGDMVKCNTNTTEREYYMSTESKEENSITAMMYQEYEVNDAPWDKFLRMGN